MIVVGQHGYIDDTAIAGMAVAHNQAREQHRKTLPEKTSKPQRQKLLQLLALLASIVITFTASARADAAESHVFGLDGHATTGPRFRTMDVALTIKQKPDANHAFAPRARRGHLSAYAEHQLVRPVMRLLAVHEDGANIVAGDVETSLSTSIITEARRWIGTNPTGRRKLWCANFMNFVLNRLGYLGTSSDMAQSFAYYGKRLAGPEIGAIAVMRRGKSGGHVGVVSGFDPNGNPIIISGNYTHRVAEAVYSRSRIYSYVAP